MRPPRVSLDEPDDYYTLYVLVLGIPEALFWHGDWSFVMDVAADKDAWDGWLAAEREALADR